jgi:uncharacterized protein YbjT (DUF2867 family)
MSNGAGTKTIRVILTGATGMVGEGVLLECLDNPAVGHVLLVTRKPYPRTHPKLSQCLVPDFFDLNRHASQLTGYDACFFCSGVSSVGMSEADYRRVTYDLTLSFATTLAALNPSMTFCYVSGAMTDSTEQGRVMWARVKGATENALMRLPFARVYNFRPGFMRPTLGQQSIKSYYKAIGWLYPILRTLVPNHVSTLRQVALAMIRVTRIGYPIPILEIKEINTLGKQ